MCLFRMTFRIFTYEISCTNEASDSHFNEGQNLQCILRLLLVCINVILKPVLRYKFLVMDTCCPDTLYLREEGWEDP
jgi:hypothetical protein